MGCDGEDYKAAADLLQALIECCPTMDVKLAVEVDMINSYLNSEGTLSSLCELAVYYGGSLLLSRVSCSICAQLIVIVTTEFGKTKVDPSQPIDQETLLEVRSIKIGSHLGIQQPFDSDSEAKRLRVPGLSQMI
jgi:hypothetical protein